MLTNSLTYALLYQRVLDGLTYWSGLYVNARKTGVNNVNNKDIGDIMKAMKILSMCYTYMKYSPDSTFDAYSCLIKPYQNPLIAYSPVNNNVVL